MSKYNDNKRFNKRKKGHPEFWRFKQHRFDTTEHPVMTNKKGCKGSIKTTASHVEMLMLDGLSNALQVDQNQSLRIALYEASRSSSEAIAPWLNSSAPLTKLEGHTGRNKQLIVKLTGEEKKDVLAAAQILKITEKQFVRLALIWMARGIKDESITTITGSRMLSQKELSKKWGREVYSDYYETPAHVQALKKAHDAAFDEGEELKSQENRLNIELNKAFALELPRATLMQFEMPDGSFDHHGFTHFREQVEGADDNEHFAEVMADKEKFIDHCMIFLDLTEEQAEQAWADEQAEKERNPELTEEQMEELLEGLFQHSSEPTPSPATLEWKEELRDQHREALAFNDYTEDDWARLKQEMIEKYATDC